MKLFNISDSTWQLVAYDSNNLGLDPRDLWAVQCRIKENFGLLEISGAQGKRGEETNVES